jgi:hypothetical protein
MNIFSLEGWKDDAFKAKYIDSDLKVLEIKASWFHNQVEEMNKQMTKLKLLINTVISGSKEKNKYELSVKINQYDGRKQHEHKENTHRQEINI